MLIDTSKSGFQFTLNTEEDSSYVTDVNSFVNTVKNK